MRRLAALVLVLLLIGCGGGSDDEGTDPTEPPPDVTLDAYLAHNDAVRVQRTWQAGEGKIGNLCSLLYKHPNAKRGVTVAALAEDKRAYEMAADACIDGTQLTTWQSDEFDQQLEAQHDEREAEQQSADQIAKAAVPNIVARSQDDCDAVSAITGGGALYRATERVETVLKQNPELVPDGTTPFDIASWYTTLCSDKGAEGVLGSGG